MEIKVDLSPEQINQEIAAAVAKSSIGIELEKIIKKKVEEFSRSYNNPLEEVVSRILRDETERLIREQYMPRIKELLEAKITDAFTSDMFQKMRMAFTSRY